MFIFRNRMTPCSKRCGELKNEQILFVKILTGRRINFDYCSENSVPRWFLNCDKNVCIHKITKCLMFMFLCVCVLKMESHGLHLGRKVKVSQLLIRISPESSNLVELDTSRGQCTAFSGKFKFTQAANHLLVTLRALSTPEYEWSMSRLSFTHAVIT